MQNQNYNKQKNKTAGTKEIEELKNRIDELNKFIVDLEFDNRQLRMELNFLYSKLSQKPPSAEDYEVNFKFL